MNVFRAKYPCLCALAASVVVLGMDQGLARAGGDSGAWTVPPPPPDGFDWVQLTSGEWLKGKIVVLYRDSLEFDSDKLDTLSLDFGDVRHVRSAQTVQVAIVGGEVVTGRLLLDGDEVRVLGDPERRYERSQVLSITAGEPRERNFWSGSVGAGANLRSGNSEQTETNVQATLKRRTPKSRLSLGYLANYNLTDDVTATDNQRATAGWDRFVSDRFFVSPLQLEYFRDPFQNVAHRFTISAGAGYELLDTAKIDWQISAGAGYQATRFDDVAAADSGSASTPSVKVATAYDQELTGSLDLRVAYHFFLVNDESGRYTHHLLTGLDLDVSVLDVFLSFVWDRIQRPQPQADGARPGKDDFRLNLGVSFDL